MTNDPFIDAPDDQPDRLDDDAPDETALDETALDETVADVELEESLDQVEPESETAPDEVELIGFDPEAGQTRIGGRSTLAGHLTSDVGMFIIGLIVAMAGLSVLIYAIFNQTQTNLIIAGIVSPPTLIWAFVKWRRWLGGAPYVYRLLLSLNEKEAAEEALEIHREKQRRRVEKRIAELEARGVRIDDE